MTGAANPFSARGAPGLVLGYAAFDKAAIRDGVGRLAGVLREAPDWAVSGATAVPSRLPGRSAGHRVWPPPSPEISVICAS